MTNRAPRLCVLIDADNVHSGYAEAIFEEIAGLGEASVRRIYGDWSATRLTGWARKIGSLGMVPDQQFSNTKGKNASDIGLVIAAMDFLHSGLFDGFVLVSSDSDFTRLAARIREQGLDVFGIGEKKTPAAFRNACKRFIYVENLTGDTAEMPEAEAPQPARAPRAAEQARSAAPDTAPPAGRTPETPRPEPEHDIALPVLPSFSDVLAASRPQPLPAARAVPLIRRAMERIDQEAEWYSLGQLGQFITQATPDFDTRTYGCAKLSDLMRRTGQFELKQGSGNHLLVRLIPQG